MNLLENAVTAVWHAMSIPYHVASRGEEEGLSHIHPCTIPRPHDDPRSKQGGACPSWRGCTPAEPDTETPNSRSRKTDISKVPTQCRTPTLPCSLRTSLPLIAGTDKNLNLQCHMAWGFKHRGNGPLFLGLLWTNNTQNDSTSFLP